MDRKLTSRRRIEGAVLALAAIPRLWAAWFDHGVLWPDEIYQSLEQAHRLVFGYGYVPWEFQLGVRSWLLPLLFALVWWPARVLGISSSLVLVGLAKTLAAAISVAGVAGAMRLAERIGGTRARLPAGILAATLPIGIVFGSRALADPVAGTALVWAWALGGRRADASSVEGAAAPEGPASLLPARVAGVLLGITFMLRLQTAPLLAALPLSALVRGDRRTPTAMGLGAAAALAVGGLLDWVTWGAPFRWMFGFAGAMVAAAPSEGMLFYPVQFALSTGPACLLFIAGWALAARRAAVEIVAMVVFVIAVALAVPHLVYPNQELRYLMAIVPMACAIAGAGLADGADRATRLRVPGWATAAVVLAGAAQMLLLAVMLRVGNLGLSSPEGRDVSVWHVGEDVNRLLADAGRREDLCGLSMTAGTNIIYHGGFTYLHRDVLVVGLWSAPEKISRPDVVAASNYCLIPGGATAPDGYAEVERRGGSALYRREGGCEPHPEFSHRLLLLPPRLR